MIQSTFSQKANVNSCMESEVMPTMAKLRSKVKVTNISLEPAPDLKNANTYKL